MMMFLTLLLPLLGGLLLAVFNFKEMKARCLYVEAVVIATSVLVWYQLLNRTTDVFTLYRMTDTLALSFRMDGMACVFAGLISVLWPLASLYGFEYMLHEERPNTFFVFYTMTYGVTLAIATAANLFTLYVFYECLTLITLPLVAHKGDKASLAAGRQYLRYSIGGAALGFIALVVTIYYGANPNFTLGGNLNAEMVAGNLRFVRIVFLLSFIGFGTKAAVFPMYAWLPSASVAPTPVTALLHAVAVVNSGAYAVLRVIYYVFGTEMLYGTKVQYAAIALACFTIVFGSSMAVKEQHFKRRLAYSTISNLSYMLMGAALMTPAGMVGSLSHMVLHGMMKITLFYCAGAVLVRTGKEYVQDLRGFSKIMPFTCAVFTLASVALVGIPPLCGFISKWNLLTAAADTGLVMGIVAVFALIISAILTAIYLFSSAMPMYFRPLNSDMNQFIGTNRDPGWMMKVPLTILCVIIVGMGIWSEPFITFLRGIASGMIL